MGCRSVRRSLKSATRRSVAGRKPDRDPVACLSGRVVPGSLCSAEAAQFHGGRNDFNAFRRTAVAAVMMTRCLHARGEGNVPEVSIRGPVRLRNLSVLLNV